MGTITRLWRSLAIRMLGVFMVTAIALFLVISMAWGYAMKQQFESKIRPHLRMYMAYITRDIGNPPDLERAERIARRVPMNIFIQGPDASFASTGESLDALSEFEVLWSRSEHRRGPRKENDKPRKPSKNGKRALHFEIGEVDERTVARTRLGENTFFYELTHRDRTRGRWRDRDRPTRGATIFLTTLGLIALILSLCGWLIHRMLRPVRQIQSGVARMGAGELDYRIDVKRRDDLGDLAGSINNMAGDIEQMLDAKRSLLLAISHELRSPITRAKISTELLESSQAQGRIAEDLKEMESLVTELLESERLNSRHSVITPSRVDAGQLIEAVVSEAFAGQVDVDAPRGVTLGLDETRVRLLLRNLISNAVRHGAGASRKPMVTARINSGILRISVSDSGPGIAEEHIEHLTDPFYRADPSRTRATGGFGLGLYLVRLIAEAHGGEIVIESKLNEGTTVSATLADQTV